jgi:hypothetical protein
MLSHPYGVVTLWEVEHQELVRDAAQERLAAAAQRSAPARPARRGMASHAATLWLIAQMRRLAAHSGRLSHRPWPGTRHAPADRRVVNPVPGSWALVLAGLRARRDQTSQS